MLLSFVFNRSIGPNRDQTEDRIRPNYWIEDWTESIWSGAVLTGLRFYPGLDQIMNSPSVG